MVVSECYIFPSSLADDVRPLKVHQFPSSGSPRTQDALLQDSEHLHPTYFGIAVILKKMALHLIDTHSLT